MTDMTTDDALAQVVLAAERALRERLLAGGALVAQETDATLAAFRTLATAYALALEAEPPPADVVGEGDDADVYAARFLTEQLAKDVSVLAANAEARAHAALRTAQEMWRTRLEVTRAQRRRAQFYAGGTSR